MRDLWRNIRFGGRTVARNPTFSAFVIGTMALGIGTLTAVFSVVHGVLMAPLPYPHADRLVSVQSTHLDLGNNIVFPIEELEGLRQDHSALDEIAGVEMASAQVVSEEGPRQVKILLGTPNLLVMLGGEPQLGRLFQPDEGHRGGPRVAMLSDRLWREAFGGDPAVLGKTLRVAGDAVVGGVAGEASTATVVGVLPPGFKAPFGNYDPDLWIADSLDPSRASSASHAMVFGRLAPGVGLAAAQARLEAAYRRIQALAGNPESPWRAKVVPLRTFLVGSVERSLDLLLLGSLLVFAVAVANTTNLLVARAGTRYSEIATRSALGACRSRLVRQLAGESVVPAVLSGGLGLGLAWSMLRFFERFNARVLPKRFDVGIDLAAVGLVLVVTLITIALLALIPAATLRGKRLVGALQGRTASGRRRSGAVRFALVGVQVSLALMLTVAAGLLMVSLLRLQRIDPGFGRDGVLTARLSLSDAYFPDPAGRRAFYQELLPQVKSLPGVVSAGLVSYLPFSGASAATRIAVEDPVPRLAGETVQISFSSVSPGYLESMRIPLTRGRYFESGDVDRPYVIVSESASRMLWGDRDPVGQRIKVGGADSRNPWAEVRGVVGDVLQSSLTRGSEPTLYLPSVSAGEMTLVVRSGPTRPETLSKPLRQRVATVFARQPVHDVETLSARVDRTLGRSELSAWLMTLLGVITLVLAAMGVYGATWNAVVERRAEIGIRYAVGAEPRDILRLVYSRIAPWLLVGLAVGVVGAFGLGGYFGSLLYGVESSDPLILWGTSTVVGIIAVLGSYVPTRRASQLDPASIMKA